MEFEIDAAMLKDLMGAEESGNPERAKSVKAAKIAKKIQQDEEKLRKNRLKLEDKMLKTFQREEQLRNKTVQGIYSANNKLLGQQMMAALKGQNAKEKEVKTLDILKKKYAWQLLYFTAVATLFALMLGNSKVLGAFTDMIGAGLGFILDMLLVSLIPAVVVFVDWLFKIGKFFSDLPDGMKLAILAIGAIFSIIELEKFYNKVNDIITALKTIPGLTPVTTPTPTPVPTTVPAAVIPAGEIGGSLGLGTTVAGLTGAAAFYYECLTNPAGVKSAISSLFSALGDIGSLGGLNGSSPVNSTTAQNAASQVFSGNWQNIGSSPHVQVYIDGDAINSSLYKQKLTNGVGL
jgi:hypothetical protein